MGVDGCDGGQAVHQPPPALVRLHGVRPGQHREGDEEQRHRVHPGFLRVVDDERVDREQDDREPCSERPDVPPTDEVQQRDRRGHQQHRQEADASFALAQQAPDREGDEVERAVGLAVGHGGQELRRCHPRQAEAHGFVVPEALRGKVVAREQHENRHRTAHDHPAAVSGPHAHASSQPPAGYHAPGDRVLGAHAATVATRPACRDRAS